MDNRLDYYLSKIEKQLNFHRGLHLFEMEMNPDFVGNGKRHLWPTNVSIDRIDSTKGYTIDNVQLVCVVLNIAKSNLPQNDYIDWCKKVAEYNAVQKS
jgi:hypothetical protein